MLELPIEIALEPPLYILLPITFLGTGLGVCSRLALDITILILYYHHFDVLS